MRNICSLGIIWIFIIFLGCDKNEEEPYPNTGLLYEVIVTRMTDCIPDRAYEIILEDPTLLRKNGTYLMYPVLTELCGQKRQERKIGRSDATWNYTLRMLLQEDNGPPHDSLVVTVAIHLYTHTARQSGIIQVTLYRDSTITLSGKFY